MFHLVQNMFYYFKGILFLKNKRVKTQTRNFLSKVTKDLRHKIGCFLLKMQKIARKKYKKCQKWSKIHKIILEEHPHCDLGQNTTLAHFTLFIRFELV